MKLYLLLELNGMTGLHIYTLLIEQKSLKVDTHGPMFVSRKNATER